MEMSTKSADRPDKPIEVAARKTAEVHGDLKVAGAELHLTNAALERHLPPEARRGDVAHALAQRETIEEKVVEAADELSVVKDLLHEEVAERHRLERELIETRQRGQAQP
jgi:hypothetical protein